MFQAKESGSPLSTTKDKGLSLYEDKYRESIRKIYLNELEDIGLVEKLSSREDLLVRSKGQKGNYIKRIIFTQDVHKTLKQILIQRQLAQRYPEKFLAIDNILVPKTSVSAAVVFSYPGFYSLERILENRAANKLPYQEKELLFLAKRLFEALSCIHEEMMTLNNLELSNIVYETEGQKYTFWNLSKIAFNERDLEHSLYLKQKDYKK